MDMKELIISLLLWIGAETNYNVDVAQPEIKMMSQTALEHKFYGHKKPANGTLHAFYDPKTDIIYLNENFDRFNAFHKGVLLHELLHYVIDLNDVVGKKFQCMRETELEVYPLQEKYLLEVHGVVFEYDELYVLLQSNCNPNMY
tara:strand:+ start:2285 stop:2716 length:432 start_codon:yes stop_codon:yes gene_type:complete